MQHKEITYIVAMVLLPWAVACGGDDDPSPGMPTVDAGVPATDGSTPMVDAGEDPPVDAGEPVVDAGTPSLDAGTPAVDAGPVDGGSGVLPPLGPGVATLSGSSEPGLIDGERGLARFNNPVNVEAAANGDVYVADFDNNAIRLVSAEGAALLTITGDGFSRPFGLALVDANTLYVQTDRNDTGQGGGENGTIWRLDIANDILEVVVRNIGRPRGLGVLSDGRLVLADYYKHAVFLLDPNSENPEPELLAGSLDLVAGYVDGTGSEARFDQPISLVVTGDDDIIVVDRQNHRLRKVTLDGVVTTLAGSGDAATADGSLLEAGFHRPLAIAMTSSGRLFVSESLGYVIREIDIAGNAVSTIAGNGIAGYVDSEDPKQSSFFGLEGMAVSGDDAYLYIADGTRGAEDPAQQIYHRVRRLDLSE